MCTTGVSGGLGRFRFEDGTTILGSRQGQSTTVQSSQLNQNGRYVCFDGGKEWPFYIYFSKGEYTLLDIQSRATHNTQYVRVHIVNILYKLNDNNL